MSAVSAYFYLRVLVVMYMQEPAEEQDGDARPETLCESDLDTLGVNASLLFCALCCSLPGALATMAQPTRGTRHPGALRGASQPGRSEGAAHET